MAEATTSNRASGGEEEAATKGSASADRTERIVIFVGFAAAVLTYALRGGTYDVVARGEAAVVIWLTLGLGFLVGALPRQRLSRSAWAVVAGFGLLIAWTAASFTWTESDERTHIELARVLHHLGLFLLAASVLTRRSWCAGVAGMTFAAVIVCAVALGSRLWPSSFPTDHVRDNFGGNRLNYPLNYWNAVAAWGAMTATMCLAWSTHARSATLRAAALAAVPVAVTVTYLTYSRAGVIGLGLGIVVVWATSRARAVTLLQSGAAALGSWLAIEACRGSEAIVQSSGGEGRENVLLGLAIASIVCTGLIALLRAIEADRRLRMPPRRGRAVALSAALVVVVGGVMFLPGAVTEAWDEFRGAADATPADDPASRFANLSGNRYHLWRSALSAFKAEPLNGTGPGTFEFWWNRDAINAEHVRDAHSLYLEVLAELGLPGLLAVLLLLGSGVVAALRSLRIAGSPAASGASTATLAAVLVWIFHTGVDWMWEATAVTVLGLVAVAATGAATGADSLARGALGRSQRATAAVIALAAIAALLPPTVGSSALRRSQQAVRADRVESAVALGQEATAVWPWASGPDVQLALLAEQRGNLPVARRHAEHAIRQEPTNWRHRLLLARLEAQMRHPLAAIIAFDEARRLRPLSSVFAR